MFASTGKVYLDDNHRPGNKIISWEFTASCTSSSLSHFYVGSMYDDIHPFLRVLPFSTLSVSSCPVILIVSGLICPPQVKKTPHQTDISWLGPRRFSV